MSSLDDALDSLRKLHAETTEKLERVEQALALMVNFEAPRAIRRRGPSVQKRILALLDEGDRRWTPEQVVAEFSRRGEPLDVKGPLKQATTSLAVSARKGLVFRTAPNEFIGRQFMEPDREGVKTV